MYIYIYIYMCVYIYIYTSAGLGGGAHPLRRRGPLHPFHTLSETLRVEGRGFGVQVSVSVRASVSVGVGVSVNVSVSVSVSVSVGVSKSVRVSGNMSASVGVSAGLGGGAHLLRRRGPLPFSSLFYYSQSLPCLPRTGCSSSSPSPSVYLLSAASVLPLSSFSLLLASLELSDTTIYEP